ncbi:hypothetical protein MKZ38_009854 [Zalerion maritima]|uniref:Uncharacterized protein n=1 Tax=Zalerion maritima TaxID=339359 RepID=A0AAD5WLZ4_9PEZI|nr:hypothetical protein MKZ38_009854 [Zalerion maritima]
MPCTTLSTKTEKGTVASNTSVEESPPQPQAQEKETNRNLRRSRIEDYNKDSGCVPRLFKLSCPSSSTGAASSAANTSASPDEGGGPRADSPTMGETDASSITAGNSSSVTDEERLRQRLEVYMAAATGGNRHN